MECDVLLSGLIVLLLLLLLSCHRDLIMILSSAAAVHRRCMRVSIEFLNNGIPPLMSGTSAIEALSIQHFYPIGSTCHCHTSIHGLGYSRWPGGVHCTN